MHEPFVRIAHLYVHIMHMLTNVHVIFSGLPNIESALTEKKNITRSIQRKIKYILLIISSIYFYIHRTFRWQIWNYSKKMKFSYTKFFFLSSFSFTGINSQDSRGTDLKILKNISVHLSLLLLLLWLPTRITAA